MTKQTYRNQVSLLINVIPEIAKEKCFNLHGGTAINLFIRNMPRLSVDIDLTYVEIENRETSLQNILIALNRIQENIKKVVPRVNILHKKGANKLLISTPNAAIKVEVNSVVRGILGQPENKILCNKAQTDFDAFCAINIVPIGQLYGGKICAAFDRQHPRDIFDVKYLLENEGFTAAVKEGFIFRLLSGERPINEVLFPNLLDQRQAMVNQFTGMTDEAFSYEEYEKVREQMIKTVHESLTTEDKQFILSVKNLNPYWRIYNFEKFPSIKWKIQNINNLKANQSDKYQQQFQILENKLRSI
ncbi:MAG: nucleotidyl transferase AbiEii/AbiGii toxin family protein [Bacteroidota bacterium]